MEYFERIGDTLLSAITQGHLHVTYSDGQRRIYGDKKSKPITLVLKNGHLFRRLALFGDIGFAQSYLEGDFEVDDMTALVRLALENSATLGVRSSDKKGGFRALIPHWNRLKHALRKNSKKKSRKNIAHHYDLSNEFFALMLDETMLYSSALFARIDEPLHVAQERKIAHLASKLRLPRGAKVLEIGSGWGAMAIHLAQTYDAKVTTLTLSQAQKSYCEARFAALGLLDHIEVRLEDYRDTRGTYDAIVAVEMFEAVGHDYFATFFRQCQHLMAPHALLALQVITIPDWRYDDYRTSTDFIQEYIFPGGHLPSLEAILHTTKRHTHLELLHMEDFTPHYAVTLHRWYKNFMHRIDDIRALGFDERFLRMWRLYLNYCEAAFATRNIGLAQLVFTPANNMRLNQLSTKDFK
ncbi:MAG: cyclopropane-fatty-acyl-phospholipid synthase [Sulfuricurvum sp. PC08-66]|nr:MAG: cyclopropane-fatty-acyl-phospholipid synthase [Sulfuricurvum sp. PC08-66]